MVKKTNKLPDLVGWKSIAEYLGFSVANVQRWAKLKERPLPKHQMNRRDRVVAFKQELHAWYLGRIKRRQEIATPRAGGTRGRINLVGRWQYVFRVIGRSTEWGGVVEIDQAETDFGVEVTLTGQRHWEKDPRKKVLANPIGWYSDWGTISHDEKIRFSYRIKSPAGNVDGFAVGSIGKLPNRRRPDTITGQFYKLPPDPNATHGTIELLRMASDGYKTVAVRGRARVAQPANAS